jgi:hypothetical protein
MLRIPATISRIPTNNALPTPLIWFPPVAAAAGKRPYV